MLFFPKILNKLATCSYAERLDVHSMNIVVLLQWVAGLATMEQTNPRVMLDLLKSIERNGNQSQRGRASEFGVALGLVNAYLRYSAKKGYIKVRKIPARRYVYYLTPKGFAEKSRLTLLHLSNLLTFFHTARQDCTYALDEALARGWTRVALAGASELAEICMICALDHKISVIAIVDRKSTSPRFLRVPVKDSFASMKHEIDGVILTDLASTAETLMQTVAALSADKVITPALLSSAAGENGGPA